MKIALTVFVSAIALLCLFVANVLVIGALLPRQHKVSRSIFLPKKPAEVYALLRDFAAAPSWRREIKRVDVSQTQEGRVRFREFGAHGAVTYELVTDVPDQRLVTRIVDRDLGYSGSWDYRLSDSDSGTRLTITEEGDVPNIFFRFMSRFVFGHTSTMDKYLRAAAAHFGAKAGPDN